MFKIKYQQALAAKSAEYKSSLELAIRKCTRYFLFETCFRLLCIMKVSGKTTSPPPLHLRSLFSRESAALVAAKEGEIAELSSDLDQASSAKVVEEQYLNARIYTRPMF
jgi:hypothetical protein